jgi:hypothetical protein
MSDIFALSSNGKLRRKQAALAVEFPTAAVGPHDNQPAFEKPAPMNPPQKTARASLGVPGTRLAEAGSRRSSMLSSVDSKSSVPARTTSAIPNRLWLGLGGWFCLALSLAAIGLLERLPVFVIPAFIWTPVLLVALASRQFPALRRALEAVPLALLVGFHGIRAVIGGAFLIYTAHGLLTPRFALPAGYGDIAVGLLAIPIAVRAARSADARPERLVFFWNVFGLVDILLTFVNAQRILLFGEGAPAMRAFFIFPNQLIPLFVVPLVLLTHGLIALRTRPRAA